MTVRHDRAAHGCHARLQAPGSRSSRPPASVELNRRRRGMGLQTLRRTDGQEHPWQVTAANNARLVRQVIEEIWNGGDLELADQVFAPDYVNHGGLIPDLGRGPEAIKIIVAVSRLAFPEFRVAVVDLLAQGQT